MHVLACNILSLSTVGICFDPPHRDAMILSSLIVLFTLEPFWTSGVKLDQLRRIGRWCISFGVESHSVSATESVLF